MESTLKAIGSSKFVHFEYKWGDSLPKECLQLDLKKINADA